MWENDFIASPPPFPKGEPRFLEDLKSWKIAVPHWDAAARPGEKDLDLRAGFRVRRDSFPDPEAAEAFASALDALRAITYRDIAAFASTEDAHGRQPRPMSASMSLILNACPESAILCMSKKSILRVTMVIS